MNYSQFEGLLCELGNYGEDSLDKCHIGSGGNSCREVTVKRGDEIAGGPHKALAHIALLMRKFPYK